MLMIRTICRCLVDFDDIKSSREWAETQIPKIVRKYVKLYLAVKSREDLWWNGFVEMDTVAKAYFYCLTGACLSISLRFASTCDAGALESIVRKGGNGINLSNLNAANSFSIIYMNYCMKRRKQIRNIHGMVW